MIILIRHGETIWNKKEKKQGQKDSPLTLNAIEYAKKLAYNLKDTININDYEIIVSPLWRCQQYASLICEILNIDYDKCKLDNDIKEHCFGLWEGKTEEEIEKEFPSFLKKRKEDWWDYIVPMGESYNLLYQRIKRFLNRNENKNIIIISHEMVSKTIRGHYLNLEPRQIISLKHEHGVYYVLNDDKIKEIRFADVIDKVSE